MKNLIALIAIVFICFASSCMHRTCPTYTKGLKDVPQSEQVVENRDVRG